jgi:hypothetical protein
LKRRFRETIGGKRVLSAGAWLKRKTRFRYIASKLKEIALEIEAAAPY